MAGQTLSELRGLTNDRGVVTTWGQTSGYPWDISEENPELQWPLSVMVYDRMRKQDTQVGASLRAIILPLLRADWRIAPNGARDEVVARIADDLGLAVLGDEPAPQTRRRGRVKWGQHLRDALLCLPIGHAGFEKTIDGKALADTGFARLGRLSPRLPRTIAKINVDGSSGDILSVEQYGNGQPGRPPLITIDGDRLVWYANEREGANWQGTSLLRTAFGPWLIKQRLMRVNAVMHEKNGMGIPTANAAPGATKGEIEQVNEILSKWRAGDTSSAAFPAGTVMSLKGVEGTLPDTLASIQAMDVMIARSVLAQFLDLGSTKTGSRALGDSFIDFFKLSLDAVAADVALTATEQIVEWLVDLNEGIDENAPAIVCPDVDIETDLPPDSLVALASAGVITLDDGIENYVRGRYNLPRPEGTPRPAPTAIEIPKALPVNPVTARRLGSRREVAAAKEDHTVRP